MVEFMNTIVPFPALRQEVKRKTKWRVHASRVLLPTTILQFRVFTVTLSDYHLFLVSDE